MKTKQVALTILLTFCCITVIPITLLVLNAMYEGWNYSVLGQMIHEMK